MLGIHNCKTYLVTARNFYSSRPNQHVIWTLYNHFKLGYKAYSRNRKCDEINVSCTDKQGMINRVRENHLRDKDVFHIKSVLLSLNISNKASIYELFIRQNTFNIHLATAGAFVG